MKYTAALRIVGLASAAAAATGNVFAPGAPSATAPVGLLVQFREDKVGGASAQAATAQALATAVHGKVTQTYDRLFNGVALRLPDGETAAASLQTLAADPRVASVEKDQPVHPRYSWGTDRVDQCELPLDGPGSTNAKVDGTGVRVYILDHGIYKDHDEFVGLIDPDSTCHIDLTNDGYGPLAPRESSHATHIAGTICGHTYGVATCDTLCAVKVLSDGPSSSVSRFLAGVEHVVKDCEAAFPAREDRKCVANLSVGWWYSPITNGVVNNAVDAGVTMVVAAGNDAGNTLVDSPASAERAITVGSTQFDDRFSSFSNYGDLVDVYAPGSGVVSAGISAPDAWMYKSGTSMSTPHVVGIAAGILHGDAMADVEAVIKANAQLIGYHQGYPMLLANTVDGGCGGLPPTLSPSPTLSPVACTETVVTVAITTDDQPVETSWELVDECTGKTVASRQTGFYTDRLTLIKEDYCLPASRYKFTIMDSESNGLCCVRGDGEYEVLVDGVSQFAPGGTFWGDEEHEFGMLGSCAPTVSPAPTPTPAVCTQSVQKRETQNLTTLIVQTKKGQQQGASSLASTAQGLAAKVGGELVQVFSEAIHGFAVEVSAETAAASMETLTASTQVTVVEEDKKVQQEQSSEEDKKDTGSNSDGSYPWGLDRVDQCELPLDGPNSTPTKVDARGVRVYIIDSGIYQAHDEFSGMIDLDSTCHFDATGGECPFADVYGQGTRVASTACGTNYGVATCDELCAVRVMGDDGGNKRSWTIAGIEHVIKDCRERFPDGMDRKCVANMALSTGWWNDSVNAAVRNAVDAGVVVVTEAGSESWNVISYSPGSEPKAITVASTTIDDDFAPMSNFGALVDVYAPGLNVLAAGIDGTDDVVTKSGANMASAHVAGMAAGIRRKDADANVEDVLKANAKVLGTHEGFTMLLANTVDGGCGGIPPTLSPAPTLSPVACTQLPFKLAILTDAWPTSVSWELVDECTGSTVDNRDDLELDNRFTLFEYQYCLSAEVRYRVTIKHAEGDGLCCEYGDGKYEVFVGDMEVPKFEGGEFFEERVDHEFGSCGSTVSPAPTPTFAWCTQPVEKRVTSNLTTVIVQISSPFLAATVCGELAEKVRGKVTQLYSKAINGCAIDISSEKAAASTNTLTNDSRVTMVEVDKEYKEVLKYQSEEKDTKDTGSYSWGLDRVDQCELPLGGQSSTFTKVDATGVRVYILNSAIYQAHDEFSGMIDFDSRCHFDATGGECPFGDGDGFGTHVASTACGINHGVATCDELCAVRVVRDDGDTSRSRTIAGLNHVINDCERRFPDGMDRKCVAHVAHYGWHSGSLNAAVRNAVDAGVVIVTGAGNGSWNAISYSPASETKAITVASTTIDDDFEPSSNFGALVDVYAPGLNILAAGIDGTDDVVTKSGTDIASAHVAGIAAGIRRKDADVNVQAALKANAKMLGTHEGYTMLLANTVDGGCGGIPPTLSPAPTLSPVACTQLPFKLAILTDAWPTSVSWELVDECTGSTVDNRDDLELDNRFTLFEYQYCLSAEVRYRVTIKHAEGDGLCCEYGDGKYEVFVGDMEVPKFEGGEFFEERVDHEFGSCGSTVSPAPTPTFAWCTQPVEKRVTSNLTTVIVQISSPFLAATVCGELAEKVRGKVTQLYSKAINGCAIDISSEKAAASTNTLTNDSRVTMVEVDKEYKEVLKYQSEEKDTKDTGSYSWGLDRVDQCELPLGGQSSTFTKVDATGVRVYILNSAIYQAHDEFSGMIDFDSRCHFDATGGECPFGDGDGFGTHVASTACGINHGVATCDELCAVRVVHDGGDTSRSRTIAGLNHVINDCERRFPDGMDRKCVAHVAHYGWHSGSLNAAVRNAVDAGVVIVTGAGNGSWNAISYSPASETKAITVASTTIDDDFEPSSNFGALVDVYAPGLNILAAGIDGTDDVVTKSGTDIASAHVAGIAAGIRRKDADVNVQAALKANAKMLGTHEGYTMLLANTVDEGCGGIPPTLSPAPTLSPVVCTQSLIKVAITTDKWPTATSWELVDRCTGSTVAHRDYGDYESRYKLFEHEYCLPAARYMFVINDSDGDGLTTDGKWEVFVDGESMIDGQSFYDSIADTFGSCSIASPTNEPSKSPTNKPSESATNVAAFHTLDSGACAVSVKKKQCKEEVAAVMGMDWKVTADPSKPGGCFLISSKDKVFFNTEGFKGTGCSSRRQCVCGEPYGLEEKKCANPLSKPACKEAAGVMKLKWSGYTIDTNNKPRGCFIEVETTKEGKITSGKVRFNKKGVSGTKCEQDMPCVCHA